MGILINTGFDVGSSSPIDNRTIKNTTNERDALVSEGKVYENLKVYCKDTKKEYRWTGTEWEISSSGGDLTDYQKKTDDTLTTTNKTVVGGINEIYGTQLDTVGFSADYKNIILNRKNGLNPYIIPISSIINNASLTELKDVDSTDIGNGKTLVYDSSTQKHKYVNTIGTDELVKMEASTDAKYLADLIDKSTVVNDNGTLKVKKLDGQEVTITEINYLKGLTMNVMDLVNMFSNGGVKILNTPVNTYADLLAYDKSSLIDGISYLVYVLADETHDNAKTTYLIDKTSSTPTYFGFAGEHRDFTTNPINLANEVTGKLGTSNIDVDVLWNLLTINDTYKTLTTKDEVFGTHGAKAMYDELVTAIGDKANATDLTTHTGDTNIHITTAERTKWNEVDNKVNKTDIVDNLTSADTDKPLSANQGKVLKDEVNLKANDNEVIKKTAITTTINSTSTDSQIATAKAVNDLLQTEGPGNLRIPLNEDLNNLIYNRTRVWMNSQTVEIATFTNMPSGRFTECAVIFIPCENATSDYGEQIFVGDNNRIFIRYKVKTTWTAWQRVCTTSVADVPKTVITFTDETYFKNADSNNNYSSYYVQNGICYISIYVRCVSPKPNGISHCTSDVPKPKHSVRKIITPWDVTGTQNISVFLSLESHMKSLGLMGGQVGADYLLQFSYPVAES